MSPWWVQGLVPGFFFGAAMTVFAGLRHGSWLAAVVSGSVSGILFGLTMGVFIHRLNRRMLGELEALTPAERQTVARASARGPAPADPRLRGAARALVHRQRDEALRTRRRSVAVFSIALILYVVLAITQTSWWWLAAVLFLGFLVLTLMGPARLERRLSVLSGGPTVGADPRAQ